MKLPAYIFCLALAGWGMAFAADAPLALNLTPAQASYILQNGDNLDLIFAALKVASVTPSLRQEAIDYLDHPTDFGKLLARWQADLPAGTDLSARNALAPIKRKLDADVTDFVQFLSANHSPEMFEVFKHFNQSIFGTEALAMFYYSKAIKDNAIEEPLFLDYVEDTMFNFSYIDYENARGQEKRGGLLNTRTGDFTSYMQDSVGQAFMSATPIKERHEGYNMSGLGFLLGMETEAANERIAEILASDEYWNTPGLQFDFLHAGDMRYHPSQIALYRAALAEPHVKDKDRVVIGLFIRRLQPGTNDTGGESAEPLYAANPKVYPDLLAFIRDAEKLSLSDEARKILADAKGELGQLMAERNIDPASLVLPEPLQPRQHKPLPMAKNATVPVTTTTLSAAAAASKPELPYNPYHYESGLYPPFPWQAKILIVITVLFTAWWFWTEWRTWPK